MPIIIKDFTWRENENSIVIQIPLRGIHQSKVNVFTSERYIKITFEQYYFDLLLSHSVNVSDSKCNITSTHIIAELIKCKPKIWDHLEDTMDKPERLQMIKEFMDSEYARFQKECEEKREKKQELKKVAVREQIEVDTKTRTEIEDIKKMEESKAVGDINGWRKNLLKEMKHNNKNVTTENKIVSTDIPLPRLTRILKTEFTLREFPTPCRESMLEEENEWLRKQAQARRTSGFVSEDIRPEERNPQFLKHKGDEFLKNKNYIGAISAYSFGIKLSENFVDLYIARSEAHLLLGNYNKTINDCTKALDIMKPEVSSNLEGRALCIGRRGIALCELGLIRQGIEELHASLKLQKNTFFESKLDVFLKLGKE